MKYFVVSDIHSYFDEFKKAIDEAGFDPTNENHQLIICGDLFDRGTQTVDLVRYLNTEVPNAILIRGNHEDLFVKMCERGEPWMHDYGNGTAQTVFDLTDPKEPLSFERRAHRAWSKIQPILDRMMDYYETDHYVFVHGWIPCIRTHPKMARYRPLEEDWRDAPKNRWEDARWYNGMDCAAQGVTVPGKTVICGHWHCSYGHWFYEDYNTPEFGDDADFSPYYADGIIAIDACTAYSGKVNCIVLDD